MKNTPDDDDDGGIETETTSVEAAVSTTYKVVGEDAIGDGTAVLGHNTSASGAAIGIEGVTESSSSGAIGVLANATNGGKGVVATADNNYAIQGATTGFTALHAETDGADWNGIHGRNTATTGWSWGVRGDTDSADSNAYGVRGRSMSSSGAAKGVGGRTDGGGDGAAGVYGEARDTSASVYGVHGETSSSNNTAAGVLGESPGSGANGVIGLANVSTPSDRADEAGVYGETESEPGYGVFGLNASTSGSYAEGVFGITNSGDSAAVTGKNDGGGVGVKSDGPLEVVGHADITKTGLSAYLSTSQTIDSGTATTTVVFDATNADDFGGYDTSTGVYTIQEAGDYHVSFTIDWQSSFSDGVNIHYELQINGGINGGIQADTTTATSSQRVCRSFSRTLFGLTEGDTLEVAVGQESGSPADIYGSNQETYLTIFKVG
jgi:hypothetical protein